MNWKGLLAGVVIIVLIGVAGFFYRNATEQPSHSGACTAEAKICPDGSAVGRTGPACSFASCPFPNIDLTAAGITFALPKGYIATAGPSGNAIGAYVKGNASSTDAQEIVVRQYSIPAGKSGLDVMYATAIQDASGAPASPAAFSSATIGERTFSVVVLGRFEGVVNTAYYLLRQNDVLRFDAVDRGVRGWTDPSLDVSALPTNQDVRALLKTLQND